MNWFINLAKSIARMSKYSYKNVFRIVFIMIDAFPFAYGRMFLGYTSVNKFDIAVLVFIFSLWAAACWETFVFQSKLPAHLKRHGWK